MRRDHPPSASDQIRQEGLEALETLANEHRLAILRMLAETDRALPFSELRRAVGIEDTGRFNYHLTELLGQFVRETESGYDLNYAGERVVVAAADLDPDAAAMTVEEAPEAPCRVCGKPDCEKRIHIHLTTR